MMTVKEFLKRSLRAVALAFKEEKLIPIPAPVDTNELLRGRVALITGGSSGIGFAMAKAFLNSQCKVVIAGTNEQKLRDCCVQLGG